MGLYIRNNRYYFKKEIDRKVYYEALKIRKGQEVFLSARVKQVEDRIIAKHFGLSVPADNSVTFTLYLEKYLESHQHKKSWDRDKQRLLIILESNWPDLPLNQYGKSHVADLEKKLFKREISQTTINRYFELLRHFFNCAIAEGYLKDNPIKFYQPFTEDGSRRALSEVEITRILKVARTLQKKPRFHIQAIIYDLILFGLATGMRLSEILNLRKVFVTKYTITLPLSETKSKRRGTSKQKVKLILLNNIAQEIIARQKTKDGYVFPVRWRNPNVIWRTVNMIRDLARVPDFTFHQLRHTASTIVSATTNLAAAKLILGHADIKTTLKYTHPEMNEQRKTVAKLGKYLQPLIPK
jgi:integrase